ncbi:MAG TPA: GIY-YIG nuclease family protein [Thiomicrorhabdus sp.]|nr:GIY-YIG nuclease family protein [Thiomicrorhabdus sp.]
MSSKWVVYVLRCADHTLYCGITTDLNKRLRQHNGDLAGGAKSTRPRQPCHVVYAEHAEDRSGALRREAKIKKMPKIDKENLVRSLYE